MSENSKPQDPADRLPEQIADLMAQGVTLGEMVGYDENDYAAIYALGHECYAQGRYSDAMKAFGFLVMHDHWESKYQIAFAASLQMMGRYKEAIEHYSGASAFDLSDPMPTFHTAECMIPLGMLDEAEEALGIVLNQCEGHPQRTELKQNAEGLLSVVRQARAQQG